MDERVETRAAELQVLGHLHWHPQDAATFGAILPSQAIQTPWLRQLYTAAIRGIPPQAWLLQHRADLTVWQLRELLEQQPGRDLAVARALWLADQWPQRLQRWLREDRVAQLQVAVQGRAAAGLPLGDLARAYDAALEGLR